MTVKDVLERRSGLRPSEKENPERCSEAFRHKIPPANPFLSVAFFQTMSQPVSM
jgi:hypothetical protein